MTARLFLVPPGALDALDPHALVVLDGPQGRHAATVVRLRIGDRVLLGDGAGRRTDAQVVATGRHTVTVRVDGVESRPAPQPRFVLVQALAKAGRDDQAVEAATELGVDEIVPWQAARSVARWRGDKADRGRASWAALAAAATKQSRRWWVPVVHPLAGLTEVADLLGGAALGLVLHEDAGMPFGSVTLPPTGLVVLVVGPEGGIAPDELAAFETAGARAVRLGPEVLRSSNAGPAALAALCAVTRWT